MRHDGQCASARTSLNCDKEVLAPRGGQVVPARSQQAAARGGQAQREHLAARRLHRSARAWPQMIDFVVGRVIEELHQLLNPVGRIAVFG
jgi:hypothetical protein